MYLGKLSSQLVDLYGELDWMRSSHHDDVRGVWIVDSGIPGPTLGITTMTHGNEIAGLAVIKHFRTINPLAQRLRCGKAVFVVNNVTACAVYFQLLGRGYDEKFARDHTRFLHENMNRLPEDVMNRFPSGRPKISLERQRAQELGATWKTFDAAIDIHSMSAGTFSVIVNTLPYVDPDLFRGFPVQTIYSGIVDVQIGKPACYFYGEVGKVRSIGLEAGQHTDETAQRNAVASCEALLVNLGMIEGTVSSNQREYATYRIINSIFFPDASYRLIHPFKFYEAISAGQILAEGAGDPICSPCDGLVIMPPLGTEVQNIEEEVFFISSERETMTF